MNRFLSAALFFLLGCTLQMQAQSQDQWIKAGDKAFTTGDYYAAYRYYGIALEYDSARTDLWYQYAESAREFDAYQSAEKAYQQVLKGETGSSYPMAVFHLAAVKQRIGKYKEARDLYEQFLEDNPDASPAYKQLADKGVEDAVWAQDVMSRQKDIKIANLGAGINTAYSDFAPFLYKDMLYYSSLRYTYEKDTVNPPRTFVQLLSSQMLGDSLMPGVVLPFSLALNKKGRHVGHATFNKDNSAVYYTICEYVNTADLRCDLYRSNISSNDAWSDPELLSVNQKEFTTTQPYVGYDAADGVEYLFFASDRDGGLGGMDLWYSRIEEDGSLSEAMNLGDAVNTPADEVTPTWYTPTRTLYFSSTGYATLGDFDVYESRRTMEGWSTPEHLGAPVNSGFSDIYYLRTPDGKNAYLASKRQTANAIYWTEDKEACCHDIYRSEVDMLELIAFTLDKLDNSPLLGAMVELIEIDQDGNERVVDMRMNKLGNDFIFSLDRGKKYRITATKDGYTGDIAYIDTSLPELAHKDRIEQNLYLEPGIQLDVLTFMSVDSSELTGATVEIYEVTPQGEEILVSTLGNKTGNDFSFILRRNKKYRIKGNRPGFYPATGEVDLTDPAVQGLKKLEHRLYFPQDLQILAFDKEKNTPLQNVTVELFALTADGLPVLIDSLTNPLKNDFFFFPVNLYSKFRVVASRPGYLPMSEDFDFDDDQIKAFDGHGQYKIYLSRKPIWDFLPLALYFDNDHPDPRTLRATTNKEYIETNVAYYDKRDTFIKEFTKDMNEEDKFLTSSRFIDFFDRDILGGRLELLAFSEELLSYLVDGNTIKITIKGFASPRATTAYNRILSMRRISSLKNHFNRYSEGAFLPYLRSGQLSFDEEALGESQADLSKVSQDLNDPKESVYSILASLERRVEITNIVMDEKTVSRD